MVHLPFSTQGLFFISSGLRKGSSGMPSSIHFTNLRRGERRGGHRPCPGRSGVATVSPSAEDTGQRLCGHVRAAVKWGDMGVGRAAVSGITPVPVGSDAGVLPGCTLHWGAWQSGCTPGWWQHA